MEALEFLREAKRKCSSTTCEVCRNDSYAVLCPLSEYPDEKLEKLVSGIEQWSKEHPIITNVQKFEKVFGIEPPGYIKEKIKYNIVPWWDEPYNGWNETNKEPEHDG